MLLKFYIECKFLQYGTSLRMIVGFAKDKFGSVLIAEVSFPVIL